MDSPVRRRRPGAITRYLKPPRLVAVAAMGSGSGHCDGQAAGLDYSPGLTPYISDGDCYKRFPGLAVRTFAFREDDRATAGTLQDALR